MNKIISSELLERLLKENFEFKKAYDLHNDYEEKVAQMDKRAHLNANEEIERKRLQKMKLAQKDKMEEMVLKYGEARG
ncbi:MAG: DUF465 domain-containing protein [Deltaproteobacteria bacterium]|nr:DUF465 domain-containing protein [Deltaproteobacteria bacterium]